MAKSEEDKQLAANARASKLWRLLRIVYRSKFGVFDRIDDGNNIEALFEVTEEGKEGRDSVGVDVVEQARQDSPKSPPAAIAVAAEPQIVVDTAVK